ncbi:putative transposase, partial [Acinetobacter baumannii 25442_5]
MEQVTFKVLCAHHACDILKQTCNLSSASKALPIKCLPQSFYRR